MKVKIVNKSAHAVPSYATELSAGMDLRADLESPLTLAPLQRSEGDGRFKVGPEVHSGGKLRGIGRQRLAGLVDNLDFHAIWVR